MLQKNTFSENMFILQLIVDFLFCGHSVPLVHGHYLNLDLGLGLVTFGLDLGLALFDLGSYAIWSFCLCGPVTTFSALSCWLIGRRGIWPLKTEWRGAGMVICLE